MKNKRITIGDSGIYQLLLCLISIIFFICAIWIILSTNTIQYHIAGVFWLVICPLLIPSLIFSYLKRSYLLFDIYGLTIKTGEHQIMQKWNEVNEITIFLINHKGFTQTLIGIKFEKEVKLDMTKFTKRFFKFNSHFIRDLNCDFYVNLSAIYKDVDLNPLFGPPNLPSETEVESRRLQNLITDCNHYFNETIKIKYIIT